MHLPQKMGLSSVPFLKAVVATVEAIMMRVIPSTLPREMQIPSSVQSISVLGPATEKQYSAIEANYCRVLYTDQIEKDVKWYKIP